MGSPIETSTNCPFCAIIAGEAPADVVCEGDSWIAFFPLNPATPGHTLVVPRRHVADLWSVDAPLAGELITGVIEVGHAIQSALTPSGMNLITSSGEEAEQTIYHLHLHVVPRYQDDGFGKIWPPQHAMPDVDREGLADRIRAACRIPNASCPAQADDDADGRP